MKKLLAVLIIACSVSGAAMAQSAAPAVSMESLVNVGDLMVNAGLNFGWNGLGVGGGVEYMFAKWDIPNFAPLNFGAAAKAAIYFSSGIDIDISALATAHFGLKGFSALPEFLRQLDWYWGLGVGFGIGSSGGVGISTGSGICYYLSETLAINADYFYTNYFGSGSGSSGVLGVRLKL